MRVDVAAQRALHAKAGARRAARARAPGGGAQGGPRARRRAVRPRAGARRHCPLPDDRTRPPRPRGPRVRLLPHGDREPRGRAERVRLAPELHAGLLRLDAGQARPRLPAPGRVRRRLLELLVEGARGAGHHAAVARGPAGAPTAQRAAHRQGLGRGGPASARRDAGLCDPAGPQARVGRRRHRAVPGGRGGDRPAAPPADGRARAADRPAGGALPRAAPVGAGDGALHRRASA